MKTTYRNTSISYTSQGTGNPLVLLHGFLESKEIWMPFQKKLSEKRQVVCIDLPGHGNSGVINEVHTMAEMANCVKAVLEELNIENAKFAGHSMGGYVLLEFHHIYPEMTNALILINSTPKSDSAERRENRDRATAVVKKNKDAFVSMAISNLLTAENNKKFKSEISKLKNNALNFPTKGIIAALQGMKIRNDYTELLKSYKNQKIIVAGKNDPVLDFEEIKLVSDQCQTQFYSYPNGHLAFIEDKAELMELLHFID